MEIDYKKIGFKSGLEIHQQLDSHKLFCECPTILRTDKPEFEVTRKLHAIAGESGEIDIAVKHEISKDKEFVYQAYDTTCLVELDEEPPHQINQDALQIALHISLLLNCEIQPLTQVMRKTVIDGSNTSGFQRTVLIARDGYVNTSRGKVGIWYIYLEEDAARAASGKEEDSNAKVYKLDRLGTPMVEVVTAPDIQDAEHSKETALIIGDILRSTRVKRGIGTIRQDINISIKDHPRIEIKGFQDPKIFIEIVEKEIERQQKNLENKKELFSETRTAKPDGTTMFTRPMPGSARMYPETDLPLLKISREIINSAKKTLPKLRSEQAEELEKTGLNKDMIKILFKQNKVEEFKALLNLINNPQLIAKIMLMYPKEIAKKENLNLEEIEEKLQDIYENILTHLSKNKIQESDVKEVMTKIAKGEDFENAIKIEKVAVENIEEQIRKFIKSKPGLNPNAYMGLIMKEFKGKVNGKEAMEIIKKHL